MLFFYYLGIMFFAILSNIALGWIVNKLLMIWADHTERVENCRIVECPKESVGATRCA